MYYPCRHTHPGELEQVVSDSARLFSSAFPLSYAVSLASRVYLQNIFNSGQ